MVARERLSCVDSPIGNDYLAADRTLWATNCAERIQTTLVAGHPSERECGDRSIVGLLCACGQEQPLAAIMMNVELAERLLPDTAKNGLGSALADTREAAQHAIEVIGRLGTLLKPGSDNQLEEFNLAEVIADAINRLGPEATKRGIIPQADGLEGPLLVRADRIHLQQVVLNLANNGMDAMAGGVKRSDHDHTSKCTGLLTGGSLSKRFWSWYS